MIETRSETPLVVVLALSGKLSGGALGELRREIDQAHRRRKRVVLDLTEVTLVDRLSLEFLARQAERQVELANLPAYIESWIPAQQR